MNSIIRNLFFLLILLLSPIIVSAQCSGNIVIGSQEQVDKYPCTNFTSGTLRISGSDITNLEAMEVLQNVNGDLIIESNGELTSLEGLHNVQNINGNFVIADNPSLETFGKQQFNLEFIGKDIQFLECKNLVNNKHFPNLTTVKNAFIAKTVASVDGFDNLKDCPILRLEDLAVSEIGGFNSLAEMESLTIMSSGNLQEISGFKDLQQVQELTIANNNQLASCCFALSSIIGGAGIANIGSNSSGCNSVAQINAKPVLSNCPSNISVGTSANSCLATVSITHPFPSDNCDLGSTSAVLILDDGSTGSSGSISAGLTASYSMQVGTNTFTFTANDNSGNNTSCSTTITVMDDKAPTVSNCPSDITINTDSNVQCSGNFTYNAATAIDNCALQSFREKYTLPGGSVFSDINVLSGQSFNKAFSLGTSTIEYTAIDAEGQASECSFTVTVEDTKSPTISGVPSDVTISCSDAFPLIPSPTANDLCSGNLTGAISVSSSISMGSCAPGEVAEIHEYSWTVADGEGNMASENWKVTVESDFEFDLGPNVSLCGSNDVNLSVGNIGSDYEWSTGATTNNITVSSTGTYSLTVTTENGCCFVDELTVEIGATPNVSASGGELSCSSGSLTISGSSTTSGVSYSWVGPGGFVSTDQNPAVNSTGTYTLIVTTSNGCTSSAEAIVTADTDVPDVIASGGSLSCSVAEVTITSNSATSGVNFLWSGPNGFSSSQQNPVVNVPGVYTVTVTAGNGCQASADAVVSSNDDGPTVSLSANSLDCLILETNISVQASNDATSYSWSGPNGFSSNDKEPTVSEVGTYTVVVTGNNGCSTTESVVVNGNYNLPNASAQGGMLSCTANETMITGNSTSSNVTYSWSGPNGFTSQSQNPFISQPGTYVLTVIASNGCTATAEAIVVGDGDLPEISASGGTIDCLNESVTIVGTVSTAGTTTSWTGPNGFATSQLSAVVDIPGTYTFTVVTSGGCQTFASVNVVLDNSEPSFSIGEGFIDCVGGVRDFLLVTSTEAATYQWTGPEGFSSSDKQPTYTQAGTYNVTITGANGCVATGSIQVDHDVPYTFELLTNGGNAEVVIEGGTPPFTIIWNEDQEGSSVSGLGEGENFVEIKDGLGCEQIVFFNITSSTFDLSKDSRVNIYPNPTKEFLVLEIDYDLKYDQIQVLDQGGKIIKTVNATNLLNVSELSDGIYFLRLSGGEEQYFYKFIKL